MLRGGGVRLKREEENRTLHSLALLVVVTAVPILCSFRDGRGARVARGKA